MKICAMCKIKPVANVHGKYCKECREKARKGYQQKAYQKYKEKLASMAETRERAHLPGGSYIKREKRKIEKRPGCPGCVYYRKFYVNTFACHYTIDTGQLRPMPASECYKHKGTPYKPEGGQRKASNETVNKS